MRKYELSPSLLSADFGYVMRDVDSITPYCKFLHLDVMDGQSESTAISYSIRTS